MDPAPAPGHGGGGGSVRAVRRPRRGRIPCPRSTHRPGQPVHRHRERRQHLSRRRRALRHGAVLAGHRPQHRLRLLPEPHPRLLPRAPLRRRLRAGRRPARPAHDRRRDADGLRPVRRRVRPRRRAREPRLLPSGPEDGHRGRTHRHRPHRRPALHLPGHRQGQRPAQRGPVAPLRHHLEGRGPRQPHRADLHHRPRLLPGHQAVHCLHGHALRPALHHVRHLEPVSYTHL